MSKYSLSTVLQLKKQLCARGASTRGRKSELIERLEAYDRNDDFRWKDDFCQESVSFDWPKRGFKEITASNHEFFATFVQLCYVELYFHSTIKDSSNYQTVLERGRRLFESRNVLAASFQTICEDVYFSGVVAAAMKSKVTYTVKMRYNSQGVIKNAECDCPAGGGDGSCKHIACFALMLCHFVQTGQLLRTESCTSTLQTFHLPSTKRKGSPQKCHTMKTSRTTDEVDDDPRPQRFRNNPSFNSRVRNLIIQFSRESSLDIVMRYAFEKADVQRASIEHDYLQEPLTHYWVDSGTSVTSKSEIDKIESSTRRQGLCKSWYREREWRLTASHFGAIYHKTDRRDMPKFFDSILNSKSKCNMPNDRSRRKGISMVFVSFSDVNTEAVVYGKSMESAAISAFEKATGLSVRSCGLFVHPGHTWLAATPDGLIKDGSAIVEVKCPYVCREGKISARHLPYLLQDDDGGLVLKYNCNHFCQVMGQMAITGIHSCFFVVFTPYDLHIERIPFDKDFWDRELFPKLQDFYSSYRPYIASTL